MSLPSATLRHSAKKFDRVSSTDTRQSLFVFFFFSQPFVVCSSRSTSSILTQILKCLLYLLYLVHLIEFFFG
jgi:hypothetical protein